MVTYVKISELPPATEATGDSELEVNQAGVTRKITVDQIADVVAGILPPPDMSDYATDEELADAIAAVELLPGPPGPAGADGAPGAPGATGPPGTTSWTGITDKPSTFPPDPEAVDDRVAGLLVAGTNIGITYNDPANTLTINATAAPVTVTEGAVAYGGPGSVVTGVLANMSFIAADKKFGIGNATPAASIDVVSTTNNQPVFKALGVANSTAAQNWFHLAVVDPTGGSGSSFRIDGGASGGLGLFNIDRSGDALVSGWMRALQQSALQAGGRDYFAYYLGNGVGGNLGLFGGTGAPTFSTFGAFGSLYMDASTPGLPYYNSNGTTGWTRLAPITHVGTAAPSPAIDNQLWFNSDAAVGGGQMFIRYNDGAGAAQWVPASPGVGSGAVVQTVSYQTGAVATGTGVIPYDDTIPQIGEGNEYMTLSVTPRSATSKLIIEVIFNATLNGTVNIAVALFQDATANALAAISYSPPAAGYMENLSLRHSMTSGTTGTTTFRVRAGPTSAATMTFNGSGGARIFGGVMASSIIIQEVL